MTSFAILALTLNACSKEDKDAAASTPSELEGAWVTNCTSNQDPDYPENMIVRSVFTASTVAVSSSVYAIDDVTCKKKLTTSEIASDYTLGNEVAGVSGAKEFNVILTKVSFSINSQEDVASYNESESCGFTDWKLDTVKDLTKTECVTSPQYDIVKVDGNKLYFGLATETLDGSAAAKRPISLETIFLSKE